MGIRIQELCKQFEDFTALAGIDLDIRQGELLALLGPSGSGKTTLLRIIAGLEHADAGRVLFGDEDATMMSVQARRVGFVFQHYALFKHMSVYENVAFGLRVRRGKARWPESQISARVFELLSLVQLDGLEQRYPMQLSGGQRQRVALARALAIEPRVLLLDEPFGALDAQVRRDLRRWLREIHDRTGLTTVFVTHDQEEALELADRVAILNQGRIEQVASPAEVYNRPSSPFVYSFVGAVNRLPGCVGADGLEVAGIVLSCPPQLSGWGAVDLYVRPEDLVLDAQEGWLAIVLWSQRSGPRMRVRARLEHSAHEVEIELSSATDEYVEGQKLRLIPRHYGVFFSESGG
ncbi:sulfate/molybdate ABC transporter ATP-binding protein [Xylella fastidiosa]|uniref:Sulfate/thiosulfate import ATP-binding protein CysA n=2 Tax=Xylella fastidiosa TaxID=2371 RepID=CYSA_XYLFA|nr:sulfate/molybdate ABC transporter ATP-binding protein [Xylella fastidiosa]Q9PDN2.1 RecName: Full=Sulfate/thiosulfate import ATP-binding protein CysA; AltName: Full=Sulfate-transporting ATPase [Xylella fastidiosa 9a5c]AAF84156.1 sulfate ABC transporter ATP-binding protein [Xylella fastidiosa 9a5c]ALQ94728.1 sulfate ABC transporter ATP-binding protein [Xylella fastidiosa]ALQ97339.1 sulfate/molybdate ABC transporter ATP-binding protein [Xylella fastidiosa]ALR04546.1 sulfate/molybdate ABC trans